MKISFTTLGCPMWDLDTICRRASQYGYDGVDFRGYLNTLDITQMAEFTTLVKDTRRRLNEAGLETSGIGSSIRVCDPDALEANLEEARRTIPVAVALGARNVRVFGGGDLSKYARQELAKAGCDCVEQILALDGAVQLRWLFETHDNWIQSTDCRMLLDNIQNPAFGALWDIGHTPRVGGETPAQTYSAIGPRFGYTHIKDAVYDPNHPLAMGDGWRYMFPGEGTLPLAGAIQILKEHGFDGWLAFEHEKRWIPTLPEPEEAFPAYAKWARSIL